ncbi:MAG: VOC family protein [Deinococcota bacterium]
MKLSIMSVSVADQDKALAFYTEKLGFVKKIDMPLGGDARWLTVVSPEDLDGPELLLEPNAAYPAMKALKEALVKDGIPFTAFEVDDLQAEYERLTTMGVVFQQAPRQTAESVHAVLDDTCGNLIQIYEVKTA